MVVSTALNHLLASAELLVWDHTDEFTALTGTSERCVDVLGSFEDLSDN